MTLNTTLTSAQRALVRWLFEAYGADACSSGTTLYKGLNYNSAGWPEYTFSHCANRRTVVKLCEKGWLEEVKSRPSTSLEIRLTAPALEWLVDRCPLDGWPGSFRHQLRAAVRRKEGQQ